MTRRRHVELETVIMCRIVAYLGEELALDTLLYRASSSLTRQSYDPSLQHWMNLAGAGFAGWNHNTLEPELPFMYRSTSLPMYDRNLKGLSQKIAVHCGLAHIRATNYYPNANPLVSEANLHPFRFPGTSIVMAHNGALASFSKMKFAIASRCKKQFSEQVEGTTDSEWVYALLMSQFDDPTQPQSADELAEATLNTLRILRELRAELGIATHSAMNLVVTSGDSLIATRFTFDHGCYADKITASILSPMLHGLWYTAGAQFCETDGDWTMNSSPNGRVSSLILASEPLSRDISNWIEVQEYSLVQVERHESEIALKVQDIGESVWA